MLNQSNLVKGRNAETLAFEYLIAAGYEILELNWRHKKAELDIIAKHLDSIIFIEVKSRSTDYFGDPAFGVNDKKMKMLVAGATSYMEQVQHDGLIRFDIITIIFYPSDFFELEHYQDAFFPGL